MSQNLISKTGNTVHVAPNSDRDDATLCSPSGMMRDLAGGGWSGGVRFTSTTRTVTCTPCLRKLAAAEVEAVKLDKTNGVVPVRPRFLVQQQEEDGTWTTAEDWAHKSRAQQEMATRVEWLARINADARRTGKALAVRVVHSITGEVVDTVTLVEPAAPAADVVEISPAAPSQDATPHNDVPQPAAPAADQAPADVVHIGSAGSIRAGVLRVVPDLPADGGPVPADPPTVVGCEVYTASAGMNRVSAQCGIHRCHSGYTPPTEEAARLAFRCDGGRGWRFLVSWDDDLVGCPPQPPRLEELTLTHNWLTRQLLDRPYDVLAGRAIHIRLWIGGAEFTRLSVVRDTRPDSDPGGYLLVGPDGTTYTAVHRNELD